MVRYLFFLLLSPFILHGTIQVGIDQLFEEAHLSCLRGKKIGVITNQSAINSDFQTTFNLLKTHQKEYQLTAVFAPEHGFYGDAYAYEEIADQTLGEIPIFGLFGVRRRPTREMLSLVDLLIYDIQDIGSRSYTFISTLFCCMEAAAEASIPLIVLDRPNPMGGLIVDGPLVEEKWRSFVGYIRIPYCHGMTVGELANLFNQEYQVGCKLTIIPMKGWKRAMTFDDTGLFWVPTSPHIPESDTPFFYPATGVIGHCSIVNIGIGHTLPFKLIGAPWINAEELAAALNQHKLPGVYFQPHYYRPLFGKFNHENCQGIRIFITDSSTFLPVTTQFTMMGTLKNLYPKQFKEAIDSVCTNANQRDVFNKINGSEEILTILTEEKYIIWKLRDLCARGREEFLPIRKKYLLSDYN